MNIPIIPVTDQVFDAALERFAFIDESLVEKTTLELYAPATGTLKISVEPEVVIDKGQLVATIA